MNELPLCQGCGREMQIGERGTVESISSNGEELAISIVCDDCTSEIHTTTNATAALPR